MFINGLKLPAKFIEALISGLLKRERGVWNLKENKDSYGNFLESELGDVFSSEEEFSKEFVKLPIGFEHTEYYGVDLANENKDSPGYIPDITDFSKIVCFAYSGDGSPFCFDYRENINEPSVIWWDDVYWRRISPNWESFISLFDLQK
jgi:hypothetical protein